MDTPNQIILDSFRHNNWATGRLLEFCQPLTGDQHSVRGVGTYGGILATLDHIIRCDGGYVRRLADEQLEWVDSPPPADLDQLAGWNAQTGALWERVLSGPFDTERRIVIDNGAHTTRAGIFVAQALNHANHHREQVCAILTGLGIEPPDIQAWEYAWQSGRIWVNN